MFPPGNFSILDLIEARVDVFVFVFTEGNVNPLLSRLESVHLSEEFVEILSTKLTIPFVIWLNPNVVFIVHHSNGECALLAVRISNAFACVRGVPRKESHFVLF